MVSMVHIRSHVPAITISDSRFIASDKYRSWIMKYSAEYGVPLDIAIRLAYEESHWNETAMGRNRNRTYDNGLYQLNSRYHRIELPEANIRDGLAKLGLMIKKAPTMRLAVVYYNAGPEYYEKHGYWPKSSLALADRVIKGGI